MKYGVEVGGELVEVVVDGTSVRVDGEELSAVLSDLPGTPIALLTLGDEVHRVVVKRGDARGRYALSIDGRRTNGRAPSESCPRRRRPRAVPPRWSRQGLG